MVYLAQGGFWLFLGQGLVFIISVLLVWVFANFLPKEVYGEYRFLTATLSLLALTALPGMSTAITQTVAQGNRGTLWPALRARITWGLLGTLTACAMAGYYIFRGNIELAIIFVVIGVALPFYDTLNSYHHYLRGIKDFRLDTSFRIIQRIIVVGAIVCTVLITSNLLIIITIMLIASISSDIFLLYRTTVEHPTNNNIDESGLRYGKQLSFVTAIRIGTQHLDKLLLWYFAGPIQVATYAIAAAPSTELASVFGHVNRLALPKMASQDKVQLRHSLARKMFVFFLALTPIVVLYIIAAPMLFRTFFPQYIDAVVYSQILSTTLLFMPLALLTQYFYAIRHVRAINTMSIVEPLLVVSLYATLIPLWGIYGVIAANIARPIGSGLVLVYFFIRDKNQPDPHEQLSV